VQLVLVYHRFLGGWNYRGRQSANDVKLRFVITMEEDSQQVCCLGIAEFFEMHGGLKYLWTYFDQLRKGMHLTKCQTNLFVPVYKKKKK
jgi:hypothetical protein